MKQNAGLYQSANSSTATLRPRNNRLISFLDENNDTSAQSSSAQASSTSPLLHARVPSPQPPSRTRSLNKGAEQANSLHTRAVSEGLSVAKSNGLWSSWSSYASSFIAGDATSGTKAKGKAVSRPPKWMNQDRGSSTKPAAPKWGLGSADVPTPTTAGSLEEHQAMLQAERRKALLSASAETPNTLGHFKRRESLVSIAYDENEDRAEALVYLHKVGQHDTMAGVMLKYGCQQEAFRKVNRFWPNDNIQTRTHVLLPVEACSVKGVRVDEINRSDRGGTALDGSKEESSLLPPPALSGPLAPSDKAEQPLSADVFAASLKSQAVDGDDLKHEAWTNLPNFPSPVEILRLPRKALGYFPRARRKSITAQTDISAASTPKSSFDMLRHPPTHAAQLSLSQSQTHSLNASPVRRPITSLRRDSGRLRSSSTSTSQSSFSDALRGPGGVGDLRGLRTEVSRPGPADDPLNQKFRQYFPELSRFPPSAPSEFPIPRLSTPLRSTPRASTDSARSHRSNSSGLGDVGGALEGWVRKLAKTKERGGSAKMGELIELETNSELGEPVEDDLATPTAVSLSKDQQGEASATEQALLDERFPIRGRVRNAYNRQAD